MTTYFDCSCTVMKWKKKVLLSTENAELVIEFDTECNVVGVVVVVVVVVIVTAISATWLIT
jgi:hypothetical protein